MVSVSFFFWPYLVVHIVALPLIAVMWASIQLCDTSQTSHYCIVYTRGHLSEGDRPGRMDREVFGSPAGIYTDNCHRLGIDITVSSVTGTNSIVTPRQRPSPGSSDPPRLPPDSRGVCISPGKRANSITPLYEENRGWRSTENGGNDQKNEKKKKIEISF